MESETVEFDVSEIRVVRSVHVRLKGCSVPGFRRLIGRIDP